MSQQIRNPEQIYEFWIKKLTDRYNVVHSTLGEVNDAIVNLIQAYNVLMTSKRQEINGLQARIRELNLKIDDQNKLKSLNSK